MDDKEYKKNLDKLLKELTEEQMRLHPDIYKRQTPNNEDE